MNGVGVLVSLNMGRFIATLEPRRRRMLAVSVLFKTVGLRRAVRNDDLELTGNGRVDWLFHQGGRDCDWLGH